MVDYIPYNPDEDFRDFFEMVKTYSEGHQTSVLVLSQISRDADSEYRKFGRPILDDLPMQNCLDIIDNIIFLYREDYYSGGDTGEAEAIFEKCPSGYRTISLWRDEERATFL